MTDPTTHTDSTDPDRDLRLADQVLTAARHAPAEDVPPSDLAALRAFADREAAGEPATSLPNHPAGEAVRWPGVAATVAAAVLVCATLVLTVVLDSPTDTKPQGNTDGASTVHNNGTEPMAAQPDPDGDQSPLEQLWRELLDDVARGVITKEQAEEAMVGIKKKIAAMTEKLAYAVKAGDLTKADAGAKAAAFEGQVITEFRIARTLKAEWSQLAERVKAGELTLEQAKEAYAEREDELYRAAFPDKFNDESDSDNDR